MNIYLSTFLGSALALAIPAGAHAASGDAFSAHLAALPRGYTVLVAPTASASGATEYTISTQLEEGWVSARLDGHRLIVTGTFLGLGSDAISAHVHEGPVAGVGGPVVAPLRVTEGVHGRIEGELTLTKAQIEMLRSGRLYVQIVSADRPDGDVRGWLLAGERVQ